MDLRQLRHFVAVAEELHFGKAAMRLYLSQPPLSKSIRKLEDELGVRLLERSSRRVALTREGEFMLQEARAILERTARAERVVQRMATGQAGRLSIGTIGPVLEGPLPGAIRRFRNDHPDVELALQQLTTSDQIEALRLKDIDIGFVRLHGEAPEGVSRIPYAQDHYVMALPEGHDLSRKENIALHDLNGETLLMISRPVNPGLYDEIIARLHRAGACPELLHTDLLKHPAGALVAAGLGLALMPASMTALPRPGVVYRPIADPLPTVDYSLIWSPQNDFPLLQEFITVMLSAQPALAARDSTTPA